MKHKFKMYLAALAAAAGVLSSAGITASAYIEPGSADTSGFPIEEESADTGSGSNIEETGMGEENNTKKQPSKKAQTEGAAFSVPGNGQLVDELSDDGTKQFLTIQTKSGNTYFMVLDHSSNTENVYMLSMIDEDDLAEFIKDTEPEEETQEPSVVIPETGSLDVPAETGTETEEVQEKEGEGADKNRLLLIGALLAAGAGAGCYFKFVKPKKDSDEEDSEELEFYDGGAYINEDKEMENSGEDE